MKNLLFLFGLLFSLQVAAQTHPPGGVQYLAPGQTKFVFDPQINQYTTIACGGGAHPNPPKNGCQIARTGFCANYGFQVMLKGKAVGGCNGDIKGAIGNLYELISNGICGPTQPTGTCEIKYGPGECANTGYQVYLNGKPMSRCHGTIEGANEDAYSLRWARICN